MKGLGCACGNPCNHGFQGFGQGVVIDRTVDPWDTSQWTITEWAAAAGFVLSVVWTYSILTKK